MDNIDKFNKQVGESIRIARERLFLSPADIGMTIGLSTCAIINLEAGRGSTSSYNLMLIHKLLDMDLPVMDEEAQAKKKMLKLRNSRLVGTKARKTKRLDEKISVLQQQKRALKAMGVWLQGR